MKTVFQRQSENETSEYGLADEIPSRTSDGVGTAGALSLQQPWLVARQKILSAGDLSALQTAAAEFLCEVCRPLLIVWYHPPGPQIGQSARLEGLLCPAEGMEESLRQRLQAAAAESVSRNEIVARSISAAILMHALPIPSFTGNSLAMVSAVSQADPGRFGECVGALLMLSSMIREWSVQRAGVKTAGESRTLAALIELIGHVQAADDAGAACLRLADALQRHLQCERIVVGLCRRGLSECRIRAISGGAVIEPYSPVTRLIESVLQESVVRSAGAIWPVVDAENRHALLSHQQLVESGFCRTLVTMPIQSETGTPLGALIAVFAEQNNRPDVCERVRSAERFLRAGTGALAGCLSVLQKLADSRWLQGLQWVRTTLTASRRQAAGWIAGCLLLPLLFPVTYTVRCPLELQPVQRRYVAAPFDAPLEQCLVEPGDLVIKDQLLARMDGREIRWELAEVLASVNKATKERNTQRSSKEFGAAAISTHEIQRQQQRAALLENRMASLEMRSPCDGVVVSGDHREAEGVPLEMGQTMFEIAPLDVMVVELSLPEDDIRHIVPGQSVFMQLDAIPEQRIEAVIRTIHPRAELRDGDNVFVAKADLVNDGQLLRPGMRGQAKVQTRRHPLGWNLFHKPVAWVIGWLGW